jgi:hypothetical protein
MTPARESSAGDQGEEISMSRIRELRLLAPEELASLHAEGELLGGAERDVLRLASDGIDAPAAQVPPARGSAGGQVRRSR